MAERNFDAERSAPSEGHAFTLAGHTYHTRGQAPPSAFLDKASGLEAAVSFIKAVLVPSDVETFEALMASDECPASAHEINDIAIWLIEVTSGRPTPAPVSSGSGGATTS